MAIHLRPTGPIHLRPTGPIHLRPTGPIAAEALPPGDPAVALLLAQELLDRPRMSNHARGLWGYHGAASGRPLTIQSTGIGAPSAAIVLEELAGLGVRRAVRVGTCGALDGGPAPGSLLVVASSIAADGLGRDLAPGGTAEPDAALTAALRSAAGEAAAAGVVATSDRFYAVDGDRRRQWAGAGAVAADMESAALFALGRRRGVAMAGLLAVVSGANGERIEDGDVEETAKRAGRIAAAALRGDQA